MSRHRVLARAPGRVNLIGEHTDYNDGFAMPMGLPFETSVLFEPRSQPSAVIHSDGHPSIEFDFSVPPTSVDSWGRYVAGMVERYLTNVGPSLGFEARVSTTIPVGASLSSSAALEMAVGVGLHALNDTAPDMAELARWGQHVENTVIGIQSGIMDQLISATATLGHATLLDFRTFDRQPVEIPDTATVVVIDTLTRRELADSEYDKRRAACEAACAQLGVAALRDATFDEVAAIADALLRRRARHVVTENARVQEMAAALAEGDLPAAGAAMDESHRSLSVDYEVSGPALDAVVEHAQAFDGCVGARMTGGGFAGCAVALVRSEAVEEFVEYMAGAAGGPVPSDGPLCWPVAPSAGASATTIAE